MEAIPHRRGRQDKPMRPPALRACRACRCKLKLVCQTAVQTWPPRLLNQPGTPAASFRNHQLSPQAVRLSPSPSPSYDPSIDFPRLVRATKEH